MMRWIFMWFFMLLPHFGYAQQVRVQTGEHASFTRVVLTIPPETQWQLGRNDAGYLLRIPDVEGYDLRRFFDIIPRTRIEDAFEGAATGELQLAVTCACYASLLPNGPGFLVIDIRDGVAPQNAAFEGPIDPPAPVLAEAPPSIVAQPYDVNSNRLLPLTFPSDSIVKQDEMNSQPPQSVVAEATPAEIEQEPLVATQTAHESDLLALEQSITESLSRGLSQGVLEADLEGHPRGADPFGLEDIIPPGLQTRTGIDLSAIPSNTRTAQNQEGQLCMPDSFFDIGEWGDDRTFSAQMSVARADLTGEFDRLDETAVITQARLFVFFGFGREAVQTLQLDGTLSQERRYLAGIANIIDGDPVPQDLFAGQVSCQSSVALWAMLANGNRALDGKVDPASVMQAFKALPIRLQSHLGPSLSERFLAIGDEDSALQALTPSQSALSPTVDAQLAETALLQDLGETEDAIASLTKLARTDAGATVETMIAFFRAVEAGDIVAQDTDFILADILRFENALSPMIGELGLVQTRALIAQDQFDKAQALIQDVSEDIAPEQLTELITDFVAAATERMPDADFLNISFDRAIWPSKQDTQNDMARRLLDLGFPEQASLLLQSPAGEAPSTDRTVLLAEIALMLGDPDKALTHLDEIGADPDDTLRLAALDMLSGTMTVPNLEADAVGPQGLWRRGEWAALSAGEDELLRDASVAVLERNVAPLAPDTPLESSRTLLGQSAQSRAVVDDLLDRFTVPSDF